MCHLERLGLDCAYLTSEQPPVTFQQREGDEMDCARTSVAREDGSSGTSRLGLLLVEKSARAVQAALKGAARKV